MLNIDKYLITYTSSSARQFKAKEWIKAKSESANVLSSFIKNSKILELDWMSNDHELSEDWYILDKGVPFPTAYIYDIPIRINKRFGVELSESESEKMKAIITCLVFYHHYPIEKVKKAFIKSLKSGCDIVKQLNEIKGLDYNKVNFLLKKWREENYELE